MTLANMVFRGRRAGLVLWRCHDVVVTDCKFLGFGSNPRGKSSVAIVDLIRAEGREPGGKK